MQSGVVRSSIPIQSKPPSRTAAPDDQLPTSEDCRVSEPGPERGRRQTIPAVRARGVGSSVIEVDATVTTPDQYFLAGPDRRSAASRSERRTRQRTPSVSSDRSGCGR